MDIRGKTGFRGLFIYQVLFGADGQAHVTALIQGLVSQSRPSELPTGGCLPGSGVPCGDDLRRRLESVVAELGIAAGELGGKLLDAAVAEARFSLENGRRDRVDARIRERLLVELDAERERVRFEGGAP